MVTNPVAGQQVLWIRPVGRLYNSHRAWRGTSQEIPAVVVSVGEKTVRIRVGDRERRVERRQIVESPRHVCTHEGCGPYPCSHPSACTFPEEFPCPKHFIASLSEGEDRSA